MVTNKNIIEKLLSGYDKISPDESLKIQQAIKKYPYFQQAYVLQTLFLKQTNSFYKNLLQETAARTTGRDRLYEILEWNLLQNKNTSQNTKDAATLIEEQNVSVENKKPAKNNLLVEKETEATSNLIQKAPENTPLETPTNKKTQAEATEKAFIIPKPENEEVQIFISEEMINKNTGKNPEKNKNIDDAAEKTEEVKPEETRAVKKMPEPKLLEENTNKLQAKKKRKTEKKTKKQNNEQKLSYLEWLKQVNVEKKQENSQIFDAIEKFLKERPKIVPQKEKNLEPPAIIEKSIEERQTLMTETLADLYVKQKKYHKAIQAFKILSLKYPKKSSYFANRIKELKQKLK